MSHIARNQPESTPTWIDLGVPDVERAMRFYHALFGWDYATVSSAAGTVTMCLLDGRRAAALKPVAATAPPGAWHMYFATDDCDGAAKRITDAGGTVLRAAQDLGDLARTVLAQDPVGAVFGLWQGRTHPGCEVVNEPNALVRNDLITPDPGPARDFYTSLFDFSLDANEALPEQDFTFLRRPDGHEIGGIMGVPHVPRSHWHTIFEVADTDDLVARCVAAGGSAGEVSDFIYGRRAAITDPFGNGFEVIARPATP